MKLCSMRSGGEGGEVIDLARLRECFPTFLRILSDLAPEFIDQRGLADPRFAGDEDTGYWSRAAMKRTPSSRASGNGGAKQN
jgi:hypothetical protein